MQNENWETHSIAIDGLAGTGKSTIAKKISEMTGLSYLDTGATYRAAGLLALRQALTTTHVDKLIDALRKSTLEFNDGRIFLDQIDISVEIREPEIAEAASLFATIPELREYLVGWQRDFGSKTNGIVMEGRDIASVVMPNAGLKIHLFAHDEVRSQRRNEVSADELLRRDQRDITRSVNPLTIVDDAVQIDTSDRTISEITDEIYGLYLIRLS